MAFYPAVPLISTAGGTITGPLSISGSFPSGGMLTLTNTASAPTDADLLVIGQTAGDRAIGARVTGDTFSRGLVGTDGSYKMSSGAGASDVSLSRSAVATLGLGIAAFDVQAAGKGLSVAEGSNAKQGTFALSGAATTVVANTSVTANSRILMTCQALGTVTAASTLAVSARTAGTSFTVTPSQATDTSTIAYEIFEPG